MDRKEKQRKRGLIAGALDLAGAHLKDSEVDTLFSIVSDPDTYNGKSKTIKNRFTSWCSDGKYTREEETTYTLFSGDDGVRIEEKYGYHDDDGQSGECKRIHSSARGILGILADFFGD